VSDEWHLWLNLGLPFLAKPLPTVDGTKQHDTTHPITDVSWEDANLYCHWLTRSTGREYRLPSEAEWVLCAQLCNKEEPALQIEANYDDRFAVNSKGKARFVAGTTPIGRYPPNSLGLFDMRGNVWEWMADAWGSNAAEAPADGRPREDEKPFSDRVLRGGGWESSRETIRLATRRRAPQAYRLTSIGFRVACTL
jgi:formylglycine-generating enzyme required for sulfatase activity